MSGMNSLTPELTDTQVLDLVRRMDMRPQLLRRLVEEQITDLVPVDKAWLEEERVKFLGQWNEQDWCADRDWTAQDLELHLWRPEALRRFAEQRFGPGVEDAFLKQANTSDQVVYSLMRLDDSGLARELWIRLEEKEISFPEAAAQFGQGPEARHLGVIGPQALRDIFPESLRNQLRRLQPGEINPPMRLGDWFVLLRLEKLIPAVFDQATRQRLIQAQLEQFLHDRQKRLQAIRLVSTIPVMTSSVSTWRPGWLGLTLLTHLILTI